MPTVDIVTDCFDATGHRLQRTAASIIAQSLSDWRWTLATPIGTRPALPNDDRIRFVDSTSRAEALGAALAGASPFVAVVEAGETPGPTALERLLWFLVGSTEHESVAVRTRSGRYGTWLARRESVERIGAFDAARPVRPGVIAVPSGSGVEMGSLVVDPGHLPNAWLPERLPFANPTEIASPRLLVIGTWMVVGGADKILLDILDCLTEMGWASTVATTVPAEHTWQSEYAARTQDLFALEEFLHLVDYPRFLVYLIESRKPDVVMLANSEFAYRLLPYLRTHCPRTAFVDLLHSEAEHWNHGGYPRFSVEYGPFLDATIVSSEHLKRWLVNRGRDASRVDVSYTNIDTVKVHPDTSQREQTRRRFGLATNEPIVLFAGRVSEDKQPHVIVETFARLAVRQAPFTAAIAGDGPDLKWLERAVRRRGISSKFRLTGAVPHEDVIALMQASDVFFLPSRSEGIAVTLYEAMACGIPVVAAEVGGQAELVTSDTGVLVPRSSADAEAEAYADAIEQLLRDNARRRSMGEAARARVEDHFDLSLTGHRLDELINGAISVHRENPPPAMPAPVVRAWATEVVELTRLSRFSDLMWHRSIDRIRAERLPWPERLYFALRSAAAPLYRYGLKRGWKLFPRTKRILEQLLLRNS